MMTSEMYMQWWIANGDRTNLGEPITTLMAHVDALQDKIYNLPEPYDCCCAYDHPEDLCTQHRAARGLPAMPF